MEAAKVFSLKGFNKKSNIYYLLKQKLTKILFLSISVGIELIAIPRSKKERQFERFIHPSFSLLNFCRTQLVFQQALMSNYTEGKFLLVGCEIYEQPPVVDTEHAFHKCRQRSLRM